MYKKFYDNKFIKEDKTKIIESFKQDDKCYAKLEDYIFYPQGGGQKGDKGKIIIDNEEYIIINTIKDFEEANNILLLTDRVIAAEHLNKEVKVILDWEYRYKQMRLHTALHLFHYTLGKISGNEIANPSVSSIEDGFGFNKYTQDTFDISIIEEVKSEYLKLKASDIDVITFPDDKDENYRWWNILDYEIPCGGIHVDKLSEIGDIDIKVTNKKGFITIKLTLLS